MTMPFTEEQDKLFNVFEPYTIYDKKIGHRLVDDAPEKAVEAYKKWKQSRKEQREREIASMFY